MMRILGILMVVVILNACSSTKAAFNFNADSNIAPASVSFVNDSKKASNYYWDFGDGNTSTEVSPKHIFEHSGRYVVVLKAKEGNKTVMTSKEIIFDAPKECLIRMETTLGAMTFKLSDATPKHRDNFIKLTKEGYYENVLFHRVINNFMVQGGDPDSRDAEKGKALGVGGPNYKIDAEIVDSLAHIKGAIAAARQGDNVNPEKKSSGSQFYIVHGDEVSDLLLDRIENQKGFLYPDVLKETYLEKGGTPFLDRDYTVFGILVDGFDVLDKIANVSTDPRDRPIENVKIISTTLVR